MKNISKIGHSLNWVLAYTLIAVFLAAVYSKLVHPAEFVKVLYDHTLIPDGLVLVTGVILILIELFIIFLLSLNRTRRYGAIIAYFTMISFTIFKLYHFIKGTKMSCGCFPGIKTANININDIIVNIVLVFICYIVFIFSPKMPLSKDGDSGMNLNRVKK